MSNSDQEEQAGYSPKRGHRVLDELPDGTTVRHKYGHGNHHDKELEATVRDGHIVYRGERYSPSGAAKRANADETGKQFEINGWDWWEYYDDEAGEWRYLSNLR